MGKKAFILSVAAALILAAIFFWNHDWIIEKDIIYLKNGTIIDADTTWTKDQLVYYKKNWNVNILAENDVEYIGKGDARQTMRGGRIVRTFFYDIHSKFSTLTDSSGTGMTFPTDGVLSGLFNLMPWVLFVLVIALSIKIIRARITPKAKDTGQGEIEETVQELSCIPSDQVDPDHLSGEEKIALFFLNLYRIQMGAADNTPVEFCPAELQTFGSGIIYELKVRLGNEWSTRRMTIGAIGEESGSKSKCFYVIYDVHMVVKIPPSPLIDFQIYIKNIRQERTIVDKLAPRECIVPKISVIMKIIHRFHDESEMPWEKIEERYIRWLANRPELQHHLKIGPTFVYFMDLSKYFFLGHIIDSIHELDERFAGEITKRPDIIWHTQEFTGRYGRESELLCRKLQNIYTEYEQAVKKHLSEPDSPVTIHQYKIREWFLTRISGREITQHASSADNYPVDRLNRLSDTLLGRHADVLKDYHQTVKKQIAAKAFMHNSSQISSISSNLLELLAWLADKKIAMRDLKPDNLLVAGDTSAYPHFLTSPDQFHIGLIDVETAVDINTDGGRQPDQPQLGGTPFYATPSHLLKNTLLLKLFGDLPRTLHLQDWYATVAMLYKVITGETLFEQAARSLVTVKSKIQKSSAEKTSLADAVREANRTFWKTASLEFENKLQAHTTKLKAIIPVIPENVRQLLHNEAGINAQLIASTITRFIKSQKQFTAQHQLQRLQAASHRQVVKLKSNYENRQNNTEADKTGNKHAVNILRKLAVLKMKEEEALHTVSLLKQPDPTISAFDLLTLMFGIIINAMRIRR